jgi:hypothetical protein
MQTTHSLNDLKSYHNEAIQFFGSELMLLNQVIPTITDERVAQSATLLMSCGSTGTAILQLATQTDSHTRESSLQGVIMACLRSIRYGLKVGSYSSKF